MFKKLCFIILVCCFFLPLSADQKHTTYNLELDQFHRFVFQYRQGKSYILLDEYQSETLIIQTKKLTKTVCQLRGLSKNQLTLYAQNKIPDGKVGINDPIAYTFIPELQIIYKGDIMNAWYEEMVRDYSECYKYNRQLGEFLQNIKNSLEELDK